MRAHEIAESAGVSKDTLRYYEKVGVISSPPRQENGYRRYNADHLKQLKFIKFAQSAGFPLARIKEAIPFLNNPQPNCPKLKAAIDEQLAAIDAKIEELNSTKAVLLKWIAHNHD
ncbi:MerR family transcriptional regulator [Glaciecola siphonariae]|uniref:MerR family transcriptional regulator n=1 Tax=Glaciecola siphonariae TaxID=521012 RepID=A0ABV9LX30_9ALTE